MSSRKILNWLLAILLPTNLFVAQPANATQLSNDAWMFDLKVGSTALKVSPTRAFDPYRTNAGTYEITTQQFSPVTFTWSLSPGAVIDRIVLSIADDQMPANYASLILTGPHNPQFDNTSLQIVENMMCFMPLDQYAQCPSGGESDYMSIDIYVLAEDTVTMNTYSIGVFRFLDRYTNNQHTFTFQNPEMLPGNPPTVQTRKTGLFEIPGPGTMVRENSHLIGWGLYKLDGTYDGFVDRDSFVWADTSYNLRPVWVEDALDLISIAIEQEATPVDVVFDGAEHFISLVPDSFDQLDFTWQFGNVENFELKLYSYPGDTLLDSIDSAITPRKFLDVGADCYDPADPNCSNAFRIEVTSKSPSGNEFIKNDIYVLRVQNLNASPTLWMDIGDGQSSGATLQRPGFYRVSDLFDIELMLPPGQVATTFTYSIAGQSFTVEVYDFIPVGTDLTIVANVIPVSYTPTDLELFDFDFRFAPCSNDASRQCLERLKNNLVEETIAPSTYQNPSQGVEGGGSYYLTLPVRNGFLLNDPTDDALQVVSASFQDYIYDFRLSVESADHRFDYDADFRKTSTQYGARLSFSDSELCTQSQCREVFQVTLESSWQGLDWKSDLFIILDFSPSTAYLIETYDRSFNLLNPQPLMTSTPLNRGWIDFEAPISEAGFTFIGWSSFISATQLLPLERYPVLEPDGIYPRFGFDLITHVEGNTNQGMVQDFLVTELADPTHSQGHTFTGWSLTDGGSPIVDPGNFLVSGPGPVNLYAVFDNPSFDMRLNVEGNWSTQTYNSTISLSQISMPTHSQNHTFMGWSLTDGGAIITDPNTQFSRPGPHDLYAIFQDPSFDIRLSIEGSWTTYTFGTTTLLSQISIPTHPQNHTFLGWSLTDGGAIITDPNTRFSRPGPHSLFAVFAAPQQQTPPNNQPPVQSDPSPVVVPVISPPPPPPTNPVVEAESVLMPITTKTMTAMSFENGITSVESVIPAKYVNRSARIEIRRVINGKVRYFLIGKAWTHYDRKRNDFSKAAMTFRFPLELKPNDIIRVKVRGVQVVRATGEGKPAWRQR